MVDVKLASCALFKIKVTNLQALKDIGFDDNQYYCGYHKLQDIATITVKNHLKQLGFVPIYNRACFIHDRLYALGLDVKTKAKADRKFAKDMMILFATHNYKVGFSFQTLMQLLRLVCYYVIVRLMTPFYLLRKVNLKSLFKKWIMKFKK